MENVKLKTKADKLRYIGGSIGSAVGIVYSVKTKSGIGKGILYTFLASLVLGGIFYGVGSLMKEEEK
jgi:hypothetical protein